MKTYDIIIIGGGPGGLAAGIYGSRARLKTAIIEKGTPGGQAATTMEMENIPGFFGDITGPAIMKQYAAHAEHFGAEIIKGLVTDVRLDEPIKKVITASGEEYHARAVILSPGAEPRTLSIEGEKELRGRGVSYCATCDAGFYEGLDVVIIGNGDAAIEEAIYLTKFAETVTVIVIHDEGILDCNKASAEKAFKNPKIKWVWNSTLEKISGDELVESVVLKNIKTGKLTELQTNGVFFFIGTAPNTHFLIDKVALDEHGYIITNEFMETNKPGVYAIGDAREKYLRQVITAAADGVIAAVAAEKYLEEMDTLREVVLESELPVLLVFWSPQVEKSIEAIGEIESAIEKTDGKVTLIKFDTSRYRKTSETYAVTKIPTVILFNNATPQSRLEGNFTTQDILDVILNPNP